MYSVHRLFVVKGSSNLPLVQTGVDYLARNGLETLKKLFEIVHFRTSERPPRGRPKRFKLGMRPVRTLPYAMPSSATLHPHSFSLKNAFEKGTFLMAPAEWRIGNPSGTHAPSVAYIRVFFFRLYLENGSTDRGETNSRRFPTSRRSVSCLAEPSRTSRSDFENLAEPLVDLYAERSHGRTVVARRLPGSRGDSVREDEGFKM